MEIRSVRDLQTLARARRRELCLTQQETADLAGVSRKWLVGFESGRATAAELSLVLRLLAALDLRASVAAPHAAPGPSGTATPSHVDLDEHLAAIAARIPPLDAHGGTSR